jgi:nucleotidyltransferase substrate binding protein (TIGR01987 family)
MENKPRWIYRFENYKRAFLLLRQAIEQIEQRPLSQLEKEGIIQRFEYTWELAWKLLKDFLEASGVNLETTTPLTVIKAAFSTKVISNANVWIQALDARNKMAHTYNFTVFEETILDIKNKYLSVLEDLYMQMLEELNENP